MADLAELIERLEKATGPDRELDVRVMAALFDWAQVGAPYYSPHCVGEEPIYWHAPSPYYKQQCPELTASIDAAVALIEQKLPGAEFSLTNLYGVAMAELPLNGGDDTPWETGRHVGGSLPIALLIALLRALRSSEEQG